MSWTFLFQSVFSQLLFYQFVVFDSKYSMIISRELFSTRQHLTHCTKIERVRISNTRVIKIRKCLLGCYSLFSNVYFMSHPQNTVKCYACIYCWNQNIVTNLDFFLKKNIWIHEIFSEIRQISKLNLIYELMTLRIFKWGRIC